MPTPKHIKDKLAGYKRKVLMFSGGKDSLACFYLLEDFWKELIVVWVNTGDAYPETLETIAEIKAKAPLFLEINSDVKAFREQNGNPVDIVSIRNTKLGHNTEGVTDVKVISGHECCANNLWVPMYNTLATLKADIVIRGERGEESQKANMKSGEVHNGTEYYFPIYDWTKEQVWEFLEECGLELKLHYFFEESSLDCMGCTAYRTHVADRKEWMAEKHPEQYKKTNDFLVKYKDVLQKELLEI